MRRALLAGALCGAQGRAAAFWARDTHEVGFGGLGELLLGALADAGVWERSVKAARQRKSAVKARTSREGPLQHLVDIHDCRRAGGGLKEGCSVGEHACSRG